MEDEAARAMIHGLEARLEDFENEREALAELPAKTADLSATVAALVENQREIRKDIRDLRRTISDRFDKVDSDHAAVRKLNAAALQPRGFVDKFKDTLAVLIPIIIALIAAWATISAAGHTP